MLSISEESLLDTKMLKPRRAGGKECGRWKTWEEKSSDPFHRERAFFRGTAVVWMRVDFLHGDKFFQHFYLHVPRQSGASVLSAEPALGT